MDEEKLNVDGALVPHVVVPMIGDGACLFRAISYVLYGTQVMANEVREEIVRHVTQHWDEFAVLSHNEAGNNFNNASDYFAEMSRSHTYGGLCELVAAGQLFPYAFQVFHNNNLYAKFGADENPVHRLRFTTSKNLSSGHFDVYLNKIDGKTLNFRFNAFVLIYVACCILFSFILHYNFF